MFGLAKVALGGRPPSVKGAGSQSIELRRAIMERWAQFLSAEESARAEVIPVARAAEPQLVSVGIRCE
jgi:hypothetical protein